jgi:hypothetical protein
MVRMYSLIRSASAAAADAKADPDEADRLAFHEDALSDEDARESAAKEISFLGRMN